MQIRTRSHCARPAMLLPALVGALSLVTAASAAAAKPHIIYVIGDDVGWYRMVRAPHSRSPTHAPSSDAHASPLRLAPPGSAEPRTRHCLQGWHNPTARTPNLDTLVKEGVELDRFYTYKYCSPTRSSFLSGRLPIHNTQINIGGGVHFGTSF